jgi:hypothetical protein
MQKDELLKECGEKKTKIEELEHKVKDQSLQLSGLTLKVE